MRAAALPPRSSADDPGDGRRPRARRRPGTAIVPSVVPCPLAPRQVEREFEALLDAGVPLQVAGAARPAPEDLLRAGYRPRHRLRLFDATYYLADARENPLVRFFVAYVVTADPGSGRRRAHARLFYKDVSLLWRVATHYVRTDDDFWLGKGDVRVWHEGGQEFVSSVESTTDLPLELQTAVDSLTRRAPRVRRDEEAIDLVLRRAPPRRLEPYHDFSAPRARARQRRGSLVHGGRKVARFTRRDDPTSLVFAPGFAPDFGSGPLEAGLSCSTLYGGRVRRFRFLSRNRTIQYLVFAGPRHVWLAPPQATTTELTSYGVRAIDVSIDEELCVPGFEYHFEDGEPDACVLHTQIPAGHAGAASDVHESLVDASPWLERLPVVREFRAWAAGRPGRSRHRQPASGRAGRGQRAE